MLREVRGVIGERVVRDQLVLARVHIFVVTKDIYNPVFGKLSSFA